MIDTEHDADEYVDRHEAARRLGISTRQLDRLVAANRLRRYRREVGRTKVAYRARDLAELMQHASVVNE